MVSQSAAFKPDSATVVTWAERAGKNAPPALRLNSGRVLQTEWHTTFIAPEKSYKTRVILFEKKILKPKTPEMTSADQADSKPTAAAQRTDRR